MFFIDFWLRPWLAAFVLMSGFAGIMVSQLGWFDKRRWLRGLLLAAGICALAMAVIYYVNTTT